MDGSDMVYKFLPAVESKMYGWLGSLIFLRQELYELLCISAMSQFRRKCRTERLHVMSMYAI
jgi:hypothetical protein